MLDININPSLRRQKLLGFVFRSELLRLEQRTWCMESAARFSGRAGRSFPGILEMTSPELFTS